MNKSELIKQIEGQYGIQLQAYPYKDEKGTARNPVDIVSAFMRYRIAGKDENYYLEQDGKLIGLNLRSNGLTDFSFLKDKGEAFSNLQALNLTENKLSELEIPAHLQQLRFLDVSDNKSLRKLSFGGALAALEKFDASDSKIDELMMPDGFKALKHIDLSRNKMQTFVFEGSAKYLEHLDISGNELEAFSLAGNFDSLKYLYLNDNHLKTLVIRSHLEELRVLHLRNNKLQRWPVDFLLGEKAETLYLYGNELEDIPSEIIGSGEEHNACEAVRRYLLSVTDKEKVDYLHEAKLILVGNEMVGKTSIRLKLLDKDAILPRPENRTIGMDISIHPYMVKDLKPTSTKLKKDIDFQLNIWDFAGQGKYREIQQLFFTPKSLYLFVTSYDDEPDKVQNYIGFYYWLSMVHALSYDKEQKKSSPVIHVVNKIDMHRKATDEKAIEKICAVKDFVKISAKEYENFEQLKKCIKNTLHDIEDNIFKRKYHKDWLEAKRKLEEKRATDHYITYSYFEKEICKELDEKDAKIWMDALKIIGTVVYFDEIPALKDWVILNPKWIMDAIFKVYESENQSILSTSYFKMIWREEAYSQIERDKLLELMLAYNLCYKQETGFPNDYEYIMPGLLREEQPPEILGELAETHKKWALKFVYTPFLSAGTINKLMVKLNKMIYRNLRWKNNCIFTDNEGTYGHAKEDWENHHIYLDFYGDNISHLYQIIQSTLSELNTAFADRMSLKNMDIETYIWYDDDWIKTKNITKFSDDYNFLKNEFKNETTKNMTIKELLAEGHLSKALGEMEKIAPMDYQNDVTMLKGRLSGLERNIHQGIIRHENAKITRNQINAATLSLYDTINSNGGYKRAVPDPPVDNLLPDNLPEPKLKSTKQKFLFICSSPKKNGQSTNPLNFGAEHKKIKEAKEKGRERDKFGNIEIETGLEKSKFSGELANYKPDILHMMLHSSKIEGLYLEGSTRELMPMSIDDFRARIERYCEVFGKINIMILSACNTLKYAEAVKPFVNYVVGTQDFFPDEAAIVYAEHFYEILFDGHPVGYAHDSAIDAIKDQNFPPRTNFNIHEIPVLIKNN